MKNTIKIFGIIAIAAVIGFSLAACGGTSSPADRGLNGLPGNGVHGNGVHGNGVHGGGGGDWWVPGPGQPTQPTCQCGCGDSICEEDFCDCFYYGYDACGCGGCYRLPGSGVHGGGVHGGGGGVHTSGGGISGFHATGLFVYLR